LRSIHFECDSNLKTSVTSRLNMISKAFTWLYNWSVGSDELTKCKDSK